MIKISSIFTLFICTFLFSSCNKATSLKKGDIFISDIVSLYKVNPVSGEKEKILDASVADISYNQSTHTLFSVNRGGKGYFEVNTNAISQYNSGLAAPNYLYTYKNYLLSDSWIIHHDSTGEIMGHFGVYDTKQRKLLKTFKAYGAFDAITGYKNHVYITMFGSDKNNSNVYEVDLDTLTLHPIFHQGQIRAPKVIHGAKGNSFGFYKHWDRKPTNELVTVDLKTGRKQIVARFDPYAYNATIIGDLAVVIHFDEMNERINIKDCLTIVNLRSGSQTKMSLPDIRPTNIITYDEKTVAITDEKGYLMLVNPFEKKIKGKHYVSEGLYFLAST